MNELKNYLPACVIVAIIATVFMAELLKKLDKGNRLKGYKIIFPVFISFGFSWLLRIGKFFETPEQVWFYWSIIFMSSVCAYEIILKKAKEKWEISLQN